MVLGVGNHSIMYLSLLSWNPGSTKGDPGFQASTLWPYGSRIPLILAALKVG